MLFPGYATSTHGCVMTGSARMCSTCRWCIVVTSTTLLDAIRMRALCPHAFVGWERAMQMSMAPLLTSAWPNHCQAFGLYGGLCRTRIRANSVCWPMGTSAGTTAMSWSHGWLLQCLGYLGCLKVLMVEPRRHKSGGGKRRAANSADEHHILIAARDNTPCQCHEVCRGNKRAG
jgi:hypothetical protein